MRISLRKLYLIPLGVFLGLIIVELSLIALGLPRFYETHSHPPQFAFYNINTDDVIYVNAPSREITFIYDGNPRGYFGEKNEIVHQTNSSGFRGEEFERAKEEGVYRIAFLGDSFTFGEGVKFEDTYPEVTESLLSGKYPDKKFESYNFGVGGYNTSQELFLLKNVVLGMNVDALVVGYTLGDAEFPLFRRNALTGNIVRNPLESENFEGTADPAPPESFLYISRVPRLLWKYFRKKDLTQKTINYYRYLYKKDSKSWFETKVALRSIIDICKEKNIPCYVLCFPVLHNLKGEYDFTDVHLMLKEEVAEAGGIYIDLLPCLRGIDPKELWVHPTDQHPNEIVHEIAGRAIARDFRYE